MSDPLAGKRNAINAGTLTVLEWPDDGAGCPIEQGKEFRLRECVITIGKPRRVRKGGEFVWQVGFAREATTPHRRFFLVRGRGATGRGYDHDPASTVSADDDHLDATIDLKEEDDPREKERRKAMTAPEPYPVEGPPPEPEAVNPAEIGNYTGTRDARQRYQRDIAERQAALDSLPLDERLRRILALDGAGANVKRELRAIAGKVAEAERKAGVRRAA